MIPTYHLFVFTYLVPDFEMQYKLGWSMICVTVFNIVVNLMVMVKESIGLIKNGWGKIKRWCRIRNNKKYQIEVIEDVLPPESTEKK